MASIEAKLSVTDIPEVRDLLVAVRNFDNYVRIAYPIPPTLHECHPVRKEWHLVNEALEALATKVEERENPLPPPSDVTIRWRRMGGTETIPTGAFCRWGHKGGPFNALRIVGKTEKDAQLFVGMEPAHADPLYIGEVVETASGVD